ncbi:EamA family transporter [Pseudohalocynthiibacter sp. F2068]|uniref:EamA family transporter n=1 Tax=Pseudohalocynthiibacter sp. F2068 TaxID=2926418 RepID=UPI001FF6C647|nr:EamA family transporter [Pseudohalocynthiibacter sp. F2068]MCK0103237.1 EamA family transporter [Pseudohalocynthiibacter sp. F2068]
MSYVQWSLLGMVAYSLVTLLVKFATRPGTHSSFAVLAVATVIVAIGAVGIALAGGHFRTFKGVDYFSVSTGWSILAGAVLLIAVGSLFKALSLGPASEVVPIYGMFVVGGSVLGIIFLGEDLSLSKVTGIALAALSIYLIAR